MSDHNFDGELPELPMTDAAGKVRRWFLHATYGEMWTEEDGKGLDLSRHTKYVLARDYDALEARCREAEAALTDLEMAVSDLMREEDFEVSETLSCALDIARAALIREQK